MFELSFLRNSDKCAWTASAISDKVLSSLIVDLSVKSGDILIDDMYLVFRVTAYHSTVFFEWIATVHRRLALFNY
jgi:hypothetical protein